MKIWVNGGSRGMGLDLVEIILKQYGEVTLLTSFANKNLSNSVNLVDKGSDLNELNHNCNEAISKYGFPDVVIHTAGGGMGIKAPDVCFQDFNEVYYKNFSHIVEINHCLVKNKVANRILKIIHIGSIAATQAVGSVAYSVSKSSLSTYVRVFGNEVAKINVVACGVNIGAYFTNDNAMGRLQAKSEIAFNNFLLKKIPWGKMIETQNFYPFIDFLIKNDIFYFSGAMIPMDSGESLAYESH